MRRLKLRISESCSILVLKIISIENKEQGMFLTALIRNTTSQKQIRNNSLKQGTGGNPTHDVWHGKDRLSKICWTEGHIQQNFVRYS